MSADPKTIIIESGLAFHEPAAQIDNLPAVVSETGQMLQAITQAALNPDVDIEKMERLKALYNEMRADAARAAYNAALVEFGRLRKPIGTNRKGEGPGGSEFPYADWPQMESHLSPWLSAVGLSIQFTQDTPEIVNKKPVSVMVYGRISHRDGHVSEPVPWYAVIDERVAAKLSPSQAIQQPITYAKRQIAALLLGLSTREDIKCDDAQPQAETWRLDDKQKGVLFDLMAEWEPNENEKATLLKWLKVSDVENIHREKFDTVVRKLRDKIAEKKA